MHVLVGYRDTRECGIVVERELAREVAERKRFADVRLYDDVDDLYVCRIRFGQARKLFNNNNIY